MAENLNSQIAQGKNSNEKKESIQDWEFSELFDQYIERYTKNHKKSWLADTKLYKLHLKD
jgi:hypothetical protein